GADRAADRLDETGQARDGESDAPRIADREHRYRDRKPLRDILQPDTEPERDADRDVSAREADADGLAFWKVVQRDRNHEQPKAAEAGPLRLLATAVEMLVRGVAVDHEQHAGSGEHPDDDRDGSCADPERSSAVRILERGPEQREERGGEHH